MGWMMAVLSIVVAYGLYSKYLGVEAFTPMPTDFFRGQGIDLFALAAPSSAIWLFARLGWHHTLTASEAYSDGHNLTDVYIGWIFIVMALAGVAIAWRRRISNRVLVGLVVGGAVAFLLALGPSLKIADFRSAVNRPGGLPAGADYTMRSDEATITTGLAWVYTHVPGINTMRALYRWELLVRLALIALVLVSLTWMAAHGWRWVVLLVVALLTLETLPSFASARERTARADATVEAFTADVVAPLKEFLEPGERVLLVNPAPGGSGANSYLSNWICPMLEVSCYNAGGDKGIELARKSQPAAAVAAMASSEGLAANVAELFRSDAVDAVVLVNFDMRANAYYWPTAEGARLTSLAAASSIVGSGEYEVAVTPWAIVLRPAG